MGTKRGKTPLEEGVCTPPSLDPPLSCKADLNYTLLEGGRARVEGELVGERSGPGAEDGNGTETEPIAATADVEAEAATTTPPEILASSPEALKAYKEALIRGKTKNRRVLITVVGPARAGKTSLLKSLKGYDIKIDFYYLSVNTSLVNNGWKVLGIQLKYIYFKKTSVGDLKSGI